MSDSPPPDDSDDRYDAARGDARRDDPADPDAGDALQDDSRRDDPQRDEPVRSDDPAYPEFVDWIAGALLALGGLGELGLGAWFLSILDQVMADAEADLRPEDVAELPLTETEVLSVMETAMVWFGWGLVLTGLLTLAAGVAFVVFRHRSHAGEDGPIGEFTANAVLGGLTIVLTPIPMAAEVFGGGITGYLEFQHSERTVAAGAFAGVLSGVPSLLLNLIVGLGITVGLAGVGETGLGVALFVVILFATAFSVGFTVALAAVGGWLGAKLH